MSIHLLEKVMCQKWYIELAAAQFLVQLRHEQTATVHGKPADYVISAGRP